MADAGRERLVVRMRNSIGEEYDDEYRDVERISDREGVTVFAGTDCQTGLRSFVVCDDARRLLYALGPVDQTARDRALAYADGYRGGVASREEADSEP